MSSNGWIDKRFVCLFFSSLVALAAGTPYLYGVYSPQLMTRCGFTASDSSLLSFGTNIGSSIGGLPAGLFIDHFGPQKAVFFGAILECGGFVILYVNYYYQLHYIWLLFFAMIFVGLGSVLPYFATLKIATANFPNHRGTANAFPVSSYGLSALVYSTVAAIFFNNNTEGLLKFIAIFVGVTMGVSVFFVKLIPPEENKSLNGTTVPGYQPVTDLEDSSLNTGLNDQVVHSSTRNIPPPKELDSSESGYGAFLMGHRGSFANVNLVRNESSTSLFSVASNMSYYPSSSSGASSSNSSVMLNSNNNSSNSLASLNKPIRINNKSSSNSGMNAFHGSSPFRSYTGSPSNFLGGANQQRYTNSNSNNSSLSTSPLVTSHTANNHNSSTDLNQISSRLSDQQQQQQQQISQFGQQSPAGSNKDVSNSSYFNATHGPGASAGSGSGANFTIGSNNSNNNGNSNAISSSFGSNRDQTISQLSNSFKRAGSFVFRPMSNSPRQTTNKLLNLPSKPSVNKFNESSVIDDESTLLLNNTVTSNTDVTSKDYGSTVSSPEGSPPSLLPQQEQQQQSHQPSQHQQQTQQLQSSKDKLSQKQNNILSLRKQKPKKSHKYNALSHVKSLITNKLFLSHWILLASFCSTGQVYIFCVGFIVKAQLNKINDFAQVLAFYSSNSFLIDLLNFFKMHPEYSRIFLYLNLLQFDSLSLPLVALGMYNNNSKNPDDLSSAFQALQVSILSFSNFLGRLISGPSSDIIHKKLGYQRIWVIMIGLVLMSMGQLSLVLFDNISLLSISSFLIGTAYGTAYGTYPAVLADFFGAKGFTTTWGLIGTGPIMIFLLLSKYFGYDYDKKSKFEDGVKICDLGKECYDSVFYLNCFICLALFFGFSLMIWYKRTHH